MVRRRGRYKTLQALTVEAQHLNQTLLMRCCVSVKRRENSSKISYTVLDQSGILRYRNQPIRVKCGFIRLRFFWFILGFVSTF